MRNVLILSVITLLLLGIVVYVLVLQMRSLIHQQHNLQKQKQDFYVLTEQMRLPVDEMSSKISGQLWNEIENDGTTLLTMIEKMLSKVKVEASLQHIGRVISLKTFSIVTLVGIFLLLSIWSVYLYRIGYRKLELQVQDSFEEAFFRETTYHRFASLLLDQKYPMPNKIPFLKQLEEMILSLAGHSRLLHQLSASAVAIPDNKIAPCRFVCKRHQPAVWTAVQIAMIQ